MSEKWLKIRRARIDAETGHRRVTRPRLRIIQAETQGFPTSYLQVPPDTVKYNREPSEVSEKLGKVVQNMTLSKTGPG